MNQQYHNQQFEDNGVAGQRSCEYCLVRVVDQYERGDLLVVPNAALGRGRSKSA